MVQASLGPGGSPRFRKVHARIGVPDTLQLGPATDAATRPPLPLQHKASLQPSSSGAESVQHAESEALCRRHSELLPGFRATEY
jgi:hypothetical protein